MEYKEARDEFIEAWGTLGTSWGINKTMAQIFALLIITPGQLSVEQIMDELSISRGNASMNLRALIDWGVIRKHVKPGERKEFFSAKGSPWELSARIARERRKKEITPMMEVLRDAKSAEGKGPEAEKFREVTGEFLEILKMMDMGMKKFSNSDSSWFFKTMSKIVK